MNRIVMVAALALSGATAALGAAWLWTGHAPARDVRAGISTAAWTETTWPFPKDPWGKGKAFRCPADQCGAEVVLYLRAKIGFCGCLTSVDDDDVDRVGDVHLLADERTSLGAGRSFEGRWMKGRSRSYALQGGAGARSALAMALHERCDLVVATAAVAAGQPERQEPAVIEFLNSDVVFRWAETAIGL
jgi:hypothetical protein